MVRANYYKCMLSEGEKNPVIKYVFVTMGDRAVAGVSTPAVDSGTVYRMKSPLPPHSLSSVAVLRHTFSNFSFQPTIDSISTVV